MPFRLLRIPIVALRCIANHMSKVELVKISLCSRKADRALKICGKTELSYFNIERTSLNNLEHLELSLLEAGRAEGGVCTTHRLKVEVFIYDFVKVFVSYNGHSFYSFHVMCLNKLDQFSGIQKSLMMKDTYIPVVLTQDKKMYTFWNNRADGMIFLLKRLNERFGYVTHELVVQDKVVPDVLQKFLVYTGLAEVSLSCVYIDRSVQMPTREFQFILENAKFKDQLDMSCDFFSFFKADEDFKFNGTIPCSRICIFFGHWITLQYLLECEHEEIQVVGSKFTNVEVKTYINRWVGGTIPDVQNIRVEIAESLELEHVLSGLQRCRMSENSERDFRLDRLCVFIRGVGGKVAMIRKFEESYFQMEVLVDPDALDIEEYYESDSFNEDEEEDEEEEKEEEGSDEDENMERNGEEENDTD